MSAKQKWQLLLAVAILGCILIFSLLLVVVEEGDALRRTLATPSAALPTATCEWPCYFTPATLLPVQPPPAAETPIIQCTPPVCAIGVNEVYFCPQECPGGCGTTCATYTPTAEQ